MNPHRCGEFTTILGIADDCHGLQFGNFLIPREYRDALYEYAPFYCTEEVVGEFLGHGTFPSYEDWIEERDYVPSDNEELTDNDD